MLHAFLFTYLTNEAYSKGKKQNGRKLETSYSSCNHNYLWMQHLENAL